MWVKAGALDSMGCQGFVSWGESCRKEEKVADLPFSSLPDLFFSPPWVGRVGGGALPMEPFAFSLCCALHH